MCITEELDEREYDVTFDKIWMKIDTGKIERNFFVKRRKKRTVKRVPMKRKRIPISNTAVPMTRDELTLMEVDEPPLVSQVESMNTSKYSAPRPSHNLKVLKVKILIKLRLRPLSSRSNRDNKAPNYLRNQPLITTFLTNSQKNNYPPESPSPTQGSHHSKFASSTDNSQVRFPLKRV